MHADYDLALSSICLMNAVFAGLFVASLIARDSVLKRRDSYGVALVWFAVGCWGPLVVMIDSSGSTKRWLTQAVLAGSFVILIGVLVLGLTARRSIENKETQELSTPD